MSNPVITQLDSGQIVKRVYDGTNDAIRVDLASGTSFAVTLDHTDSIVSLGTEDGTVGGTYHAIKVASDGTTQVGGSVVHTGSLINVSWDYIAATYPSGTQEVYTYKTGGSGGSTVATVTINYTDSAKTSILNLART